MGSGGTCHECGRYRCECDYDPIQHERNKFVCAILSACRRAGVTIHFDWERAEECGIEEPSFLSDALNENGMGFVVTLSDIEQKLRGMQDG